KDLFELSLANCLLLTAAFIAAFGIDFPTLQSSPIAWRQLSDLLLRVPCGSCPQVRLRFLELSEQTELQLPHLYSPPCVRGRAPVVCPQASPAATMRWRSRQCQVRAQQ